MIAFILALLSPLWGGLIYGFERVLRAKMQRRIGPPLLQPFYDMLKLINKRALFINNIHRVLGLFYFLTLWLTIFLIFFGANLLYIISFHLMASLFYILAGFSVKSIFSNLGANRKLLSIVAYEPILFLNAIAFYLYYGSFEISQILESTHSVFPLLLSYLALLLITPAITGQSPFDAPKAHQELVGGIDVEFGGILYEMIYMAKFLETIFIYSFIYILCGGHHLMGIFLVLFSFLLVNLIDNATARIKISDMVRLIYSYGFGLSILSIMGSLL
ncbi:NADH-quinone oxidoreductase subunit H [Sulfurospirillum sp. 1612]|uniref:NADH-quinone oxidoreductase subunit H n=1 Tax=Sulfurospirillum sp. 1612 TaxID=3094835 RepID=UPI002F922EAF